MRLPRFALTLITVWGVVLFEAGTAFALAAFRTPNGAAYCGVSEGEPPISLICWTPNDGFTISITQNGSRARHAYLPSNRHFYDPYVGRVLRFGQTWGM
jgi:hypothetical protein